MTEIAGREKLVWDLQVKGRPLIPSAGAVAVRRLEGGFSESDMIRTIRVPLVIALTPSSIREANKSFVSNVKDTVLSICRENAPVRRKSGLLRPQERFMMCFIVSSFRDK